MTAKESKAVAFAPEQLAALADRATKRANRNAAKMWPPGHDREVTARNLQQRYYAEYVTPAKMTYAAMQSALHAAEAESALKDAQESEDIEYALRGEAESRIAALQSRLDAVVGLADGLAQRGCDMQARVDQSFAEEAEHTYYHGYTNVISESADAIRSAALGCATTGELK